MQHAIKYENNSNYLQYLYLDHYISITCYEMTINALTEEIFDLVNVDV